MSPAAHGSYELPTPARPGETVIRRSTAVPADSPLPTQPSAEVNTGPPFYIALLHSS